MKILVTGSKGFIAQNLIERLKENNNYTIFSYDIDSSLEDLDKFTKECDFVFHLAGVNRPKDEKEFLEAFNKAVSEKTPCLIDCGINIDEMVFPMVPAGKPIDELLLEAES